MLYDSRRSGLIFLVFAFLLGRSTLDLNAAARLRIVSANLTSGTGQKYESPGLNILKGLNPDIIAIQEFNYSNNTSANFREMVDSTFGADFSYFRESDPAYSIPNGIISRYPIGASGSWDDPVLSNRGFAWARIQLTPSNDLYVVSVHLYASGSAADRNTEANAIKTQVLDQFPSGAWVVVAGDFNTSDRAEPALVTFGTFLSDDPVPTDAESGGNPNTNQNRNAPYDYVLPNFAMTNSLVPVVFPSHAFANGLVFDSRVYLPLSDVPMVVATDSAASGMQHMAVVKDFDISSLTGTSRPVSIVTQPHSEIVPAGSNATFQVTATGTAPLSFQWYFSGEPLSGATSSDFTRTSVQAGDAGEYYVVVTNSINSVTSEVATLTVNSSPYIIKQPQSQAVLPGQTASFTVQAGGPALHYQWRFNGVPIDNATASSYSRTNVQPPDAGSYAVVITNTSGSATSEVALLTIVSQNSSVLAQWNFNNTNVSLASPSPSIGVGTITLVGGTTSAWVSGSGSTDTNNPNNAWNTTTYPPQGTGNKTAGIQFKVSTAGRQNITIKWDQRDSNTGSKYLRLQFSTNGINFRDFPSSTAVNAALVFESKTNNLGGIEGVDNNPDFAFRLVAEFESTAGGTTNANYVGAGGTYGPGGTIRLDMVTVSGAPIQESPATPANLGAAKLDPNGQFQFNVTGTTGAVYIVQGTTNLANATWINIVTNVSPFTVIDANEIPSGQRYYRAVWMP